MAAHDELRLLSIFHYVLAGLSALFGLLPLIYVGFGAAILSGRLDGGKGGPPPPFLGWFVIGLGLFLMALAFLYVAGLIWAGRSLARRRSWILCMVVAGISCAFAPLGTALGVFTIVVLARPEVKALFERPAAGA
jgi:hypothetical protein